MAKVDIAEDLVPIGEFKTRASQLSRKLHETGRPLLITQNGKASAVVLTPEEFEQLGDRAYVQRKIKGGTLGRDQDLLGRPASQASEEAYPCQSR